MRRFALAAVLVVAAALATGGIWQWQTRQSDMLVGSGTVVTEARDLSNFNAIHLYGVGTLRITQGASVSLQVRADDNILPLVRSEVRDGTLNVSVGPPDRPRRVRATELTFDVGVRSLSQVTVDGAAQVRAGTIDTDELRLEMNGAADVAIDDLTATRLRIDSAGGSRLDLAGSVEAQEVSMQGAGEYNARGLQSTDATLDLTGAGHATVSVSKTLDVTITGASVVEYAGAPRVVQQVTGIGVVRPLGP